MRKLALALLSLVLASCATAQKLDAANDVHDLLVSIRDNDRAAFDAHVDRVALRRDIERLLVTEGRKDPRLSGVAALLAPSLAAIAGEALVQPEVFRLVASRYGYSRNTKIPSALAISQLLRRLPDGRVCAPTKKDGPCLLDFTQGADGRWRLSGFEGDASMLQTRR